MEQNKPFTIDQFKKMILLTSKISRILNDYIDPWKEECNNYEETYQKMIIKLAEINQIVLDHNNMKTTHQKDSN